MSKPRKPPPGARMKTGQEGYFATCAMTDEVVARARASGPIFRFPPRDFALIASIADVGKRLAENAAALELLTELEAETQRRKLDAPTAMMLRAALEVNAIPVRYVSPEEFAEEIGLSVPTGEN